MLGDYQFWKKIYEEDVRNNYRLPNYRENYSCTLMPLIAVLAWISVLGYEFYYISKILIKVENKEIQDKNSQNY